MRDSTSMLAAAALAIGLAASPLAAHMLPQHASAQSVRTDSLSTAEREFVVGRPVFLRSTHTRIGTIVDVDSAHAFPRGFPRARMRAVLIRHTDGPMDWIPVEGITRIYTTSR